MHKNQTFTLSLPRTVNIAKPIYKGCVPMHTTSKRIDLESPDCTGFDENVSKLDQHGLSSSIRLEVMYV